MFLEDYAYDAFGNAMDDASEAADYHWQAHSAAYDNPFRCCGEYLDSEINTYYLRARYYDPSIGRFLSENSNKGNYNSLLSLDANGVYHARQDALQRYGGYNDFYDSVFNAATSMKKAKFQFSMNGQDYIFWAWKGGYLNMGAGAELGIYKRLVINGTATDQWIVDTSLALPMTMTLSDNDGNLIASYNPAEPQWWITSFNPYYQDVSADSLSATYTVDFSGNAGMFIALYNSWWKDTRWVFDMKTYTATFTF